MKPTPLTNYIVLAAVLAGVSACAQSNGVPGPQDYEKFSHFIADRNIFDPNRQPHYYSSHTTHISHPFHPNRSPSIQLVGAMSYDKGMFAFFSGNSDDLSSVLQTGGKIQGYTVTEITSDFVLLEAVGQKEPHRLNIGDGLREENGKWIFADASDLPLMDSASAATGSSSGSTNTESASPAPSAPASASEPNDILKRLMQQREKENQ